MAATILLAVYGLYRWASADPEIDAEIAKEQFREQQDWRSLRRSGSDSTPPKRRDRLQRAP